ncbi:hypothetical protein BASA62_007409 [Batrachochytrium salamandrivorans]|nr:hypothetical protein BASA62_007409 [Batrachochytrium salamandrivorans]
MQLSALFLSTITVMVCVNAATIPSNAKAEGQDNLLQARSYDSVDSGNEAHLERRSPGYATHNFGGFGGNGFGVRSWNMVQPGLAALAMALVALAMVVLVALVVASECQAGISRIPQQTNLNNVINATLHDLVIMSIAPPPLMCPLFLLILPLSM